jgi:hypothetical protein
MQLIKNLYGDIFTYQGAKRGKIFQHLEKGIKNLLDFKNVLRYNGYKKTDSMFPNDPSQNNAGHGISARFDLGEKGNLNLSGGIDCKVINSELISNLSTLMVSGPTTENNENLKVFKWSDFDDLDIKHTGLPDKYDFKWLLASPDNIKYNKKNDLYEFK